MIKMTSTTDVPQISYTNLLELCQEFCVLLNSSIWTG